MTKSRDEYVICGICGFKSSNLTTHIIYTHKMTNKEYKERFPNLKVRINTSKSKKRCKKTKKYGKPKLISNLCKCGCGKNTKPGNIWIIGHCNTRPKTKKHKEKIRRFFKGKTYEKLYGLEKAIVKIEKLQKAFSLDKHWNWQDGKSYEKYGLEFNKSLKDQIRKRDNYQCQECLIHEKQLRTKNNKRYKLNIHHIDYDKTNNSPENLISLCRSCHFQTNYERDKWMAHYKSRVITNLNSGRGD